MNTTNATNYVLAAANRIGTAYLLKPHRIEAGHYRLTLDEGHVFRYIDITDSTNGAVTIRIVAELPQESPRTRQVTQLLVLSSEVQDAILDAIVSISISPGTPPHPRYFLPAQGIGFATSAAFEAVYNRRIDA
jgi:hypothetical protein